MGEPLKEGEDYYLLGDGRMVFTERFHLKRGYCCGSTCRHCPYGHEAVPNPESAHPREGEDSAETH